MEISVLMSIYKNDVVEQVKIAIDSILNQTVPPSQIVVVVDGPIPELLSHTICNYARDKRFEIVRLEENSGLGNALCIGLQHCRYDFVARMDSDDYSLPTRFERQIAYLKEHPNVDVVGGHIAEYDSTMSNCIAKRAVPCDMEEIRRVIRKRNPINHVSVLYKKEAVLAAGNYKTCLLFEDYYLWCRMFLNGSQFHNLDDILVNVRTGQDMYKRRGGREYNRAIINFQRKLLDLGMINFFEFCGNVVIRLCVANMPNRVRGSFYRKLLRRQPRT